ncbi:GNAT family N-acetyltransferase [Actinoplanes philippinensis]|uniref:GNAT family N-acetyltransferase n=1 Tax=Actinoplanes philippinensis TaxID=35752 RepID=UPI0033D8BA28
MTSIGLRPATDADSNRCYQLHRAAMRGYIEAIWGWNEADQQTFHDRGFDPAHTRIITADGHDAGALIVDYQPDQIYLSRIEIHPDFQGRGIGSQLIRLLLREGAARGQSVELDVLTVNPRACALYQRLGFQEINRHGPNDIKIRMRAQLGSGTVHNS